MDLLREDVSICLSQSTTAEGEFLVFTYAEKNRTQVIKRKCMQWCHTERAVN